MSAILDNVPVPAWLRATALGIALAISALGISGCKAPNWMGDNFHDDMAHWGETQRPPDHPDGGSSELLGVDAKSQQIERNLGVR